MKGIWSWLRRYELPHLNLANGFANLLGVVFISVVSRYMVKLHTPQLVDADIPMGMVFDPILFIAVGLVTWRYEMPYNALYGAMRRGETLSDEETSLAKRRLLSEPLFLVKLNLSTWSFAALFYAAFHYVNDMPAQLIVFSAVRGLVAGLLTAAATFFLTEFILRKKLSPLFFPQGGQSSVLGAHRITVRVKLLMFITAVNIVPLLLMLLISLDSAFKADAGSPLEQLRAPIVALSVLFMALGALLAVLTAKTIATPLDDMTRALKKVRSGKLDVRVGVTGNDELGYAGDTINSMIEGLKERDRLRIAMNLASELQQRLLPGEPPEAKGLDLAGACIYSVETGGDYYDFFRREDGQLCVAVGDVSGHGLDAALLMTAARGALRQRADLSGGPAEIIMDVNRRIAIDTMESGMFISLFYLEIDEENRTLKWVRAGHDPAIVFNRPAQEFRELAGPGITCGITDSVKFDEQVGDLKSGDIVFIGTDGIWEAKDASGSMFGHDRLRKLIRESAELPAHEIVRAIVEDVARFTGYERFEDDVTMTVIKDVVPPTE